MIPRCVSIILTVALGTTAPVLSVTWPLAWATFTCCARAAGAAISRQPSIADMTLSHVLCILVSLATGRLQAREFRSLQVLGCVSLTEKHCQPARRAGSVFHA